MQKKIHKDQPLHYLILIGGHLLFAVLFSFSAIFWKERQAYDASHYLIELINTQHFFIAHLRPISIVSQWLPLLGIIFHAPLSLILKLYSVGDILYYYLLFLLLGYGLKDIKGSLILLLTVCLSVKYTFYCPVTELLQGMALLPVWYCLLQRSFRLQSVLSVFLLFFLISAHPLMFIPVGVLLIYWTIKSPAKKALILHWIIFLIFTVAKFLFLDQYDHQKTFYPVVYNDYSAFGNLTDVSYLFSFLYLLVAKQTAVVILFFFTIISYVIQKEFKKLTIFLLSVLGFLLIILVTHHFTEITNYSERMLLPICSLIAFPFCDAVFQIRTIILKQSVLIFCFVMLFLRMPIIYATSLPYTLRNQQMEELIHQSQKMHLQKVIADEDILEQEPFANTGWCYSIESTILSALAGPDSVVSIAMKKEHIKRIAEQKTILHPTDWIKWTEVIVPYNQLSSYYFHFKPGNYLPLITTDSIKRKFNLSIQPEVIHLEKSTYLAKITIDNSSSERVRVGDSLLKLNFTAYKKSDAGNTIKSTIHFESDFIGKTFLRIPFDISDRKGAWVLSVGIPNEKNIFTRNVYINK